MKKCNKCPAKYRTNYTHGTMSKKRTIYITKHDKKCVNNKEK